MRLSWNGGRMIKGMRVEPRSPYSWRIFWGDLTAGLIRLLAHIPFAMGIGVVSGMGVPAALYCVIIVGTVGALLGGTRAIISGPSIPIAVIAGTVLSSGDVDILQIGMIVMMAGAMQVAFALLGLGRYMAYLPHIVLTGFMSGIGFFLVWSQSWRLIELGTADVAVACASLAVILVWPPAWKRYVPSPLAGVAVGWVIAAQWLPGAALIGVLPTGLPDVVLTMPSLDFLASAIAPAFLIAVISSTHTLMVALAADSRTGGQHNATRQLAATGVANMAGGVFGTVPGSGMTATMGTIAAGGKTVICGIVVSAGMVGVVLGLGPYLATLPIAALIVVVGWIGCTLVDWHLVRGILRVERRYSVAFLVTVGIATAGEPLLAMVFGFVAASIANAAAREQAEMDSVLSVAFIDQTFFPETDDCDPFSARVGMLALRGSFTVASSRKLAKLLEGDIRGHELVIFDLSGMTHMDDSAAHLLQLLLRKAQTMGIKVLVLGIPKRVLGSIDAFDVLRDVPVSRIVDTIEDARRVAARLLDSNNGLDSGARSA